MNRKRSKKALKILSAVFLAALFILTVIGIGIIIVSLSSGSHCTRADNSLLYRIFGILTITLLGGFLLLGEAILFLSLFAPEKTVRIRVTGRSASSVRDYEGGSDANVYSVACKFIDSKHPERVHKLNCPYFLYSSLETNGIYTVTVKLTQIKGLHTGQAKSKSKRRKRR